MQMLGATLKVGPSGQATKARSSAVTFARKAFPGWRFCCSTSETAIDTGMHTATICNAQSVCDEDPIADCVCKTRVVSQHRIDCVGSMAFVGRTYELRPVIDITMLAWQSRNSEVPRLNLIILPIKPNKNSPPSRSGQHVIHPTVACQPLLHSQVCKRC